MTKESGLRDDKRPEPTENQRYLLYDWSQGRKHGLLHCHSDLKCLLHEASLLGRTAVIQNLPLDSGHNFKVPVSGDPERYFTLPSPAPGSDKKAVRWLRFKEFESEPRHTASSQIKHIGQREGHFISREDDRRYRLIVRKLSAADINNLPFRLLLKNWLGSLSEVAMVPDLQASKEARNLSGEILKSMGLTSAVSGRGSPRSGAADDGFYACLHLRWGDRADDYGFVMRQFLAPKAIRWRLNRIADLPRGCPLYVMSDLWDCEHFHCLRRDYRVWRYHDFPQLRPLAPCAEESGQDSSHYDSFFLFSVETELMRRAAVKIFTERRRWQPPLGQSAEKSRTYRLFYRPKFFIRMQQSRRQLLYRALAARKGIRSSLPGWWTKLLTLLSRWRRI